MTEKKDIQITLRLSKSEKAMILSMQDKYSKMEGMTLSEILRLVGVCAANCSEKTFQRMVTEGHQGYFTKKLEEVNAELADLADLD